MTSQSRNCRFNHAIWPLTLTHAISGLGWSGNDVTGPLPQKRAHELPNDVFIVGEGAGHICSPIDWPFGTDRSGNGILDSSDSYPRDYNNGEPRRHAGGSGGGHANYAFVDGSTQRADFEKWETGFSLWRH